MHEADPQVKPPATDAAVALAAERGVDLATVEHDGERIVHPDVVRHLAAREAQGEPPTGGEGGPSNATQSVVPHSPDAPKATEPDAAEAPTVDAASDATVSYVVKSTIMMNGVRYPGGSRLGLPRRTGAPMVARNQLEEVAPAAACDPPAETPPAE